jgi:hypothetical protein
MLSHTLTHSSEEDSEYLTEIEYQRRKLRTGHKMLSKFVEDPPPAPPDINRDGSRREVAHYLGPDEVWDPEDFIKHHYAEMQREDERVLGFQEIRESMQPEEPPARIKAPSRFLPTENVITLKDAFHSGAKIGSASYLFYRMKDYANAIRRKRPWPRGGRIAYMVDLTRNEARNINLNIKKLVVKLEKLSKEHNANIEHQRDKALRLMFLLSDNFYKLKTVLSNLKMYNGLLKGHATIGFMNTIVRDKDAFDEKDPFYAERDEFYAKETALLEKLVLQSTDMIESARDLLANFNIDSKYYKQWRNENWKAIRQQINRYKGAGSMTAQGIQGAVISIINAGIAAGVHSPAAAAASIFYFISTVARIIETAVRVHLENQLIEHAENPRDEVTKLSGNSTKAVKKTHENINTLSKVELVVNQIEGFGNTGFNIAGTVSGLPLTTGRPATTMPPVESLTAPVMSRVHSLWGNQNKSQPISSYRRGLRR